MQELYLLLIFRISLQQHLWLFIQTSPLVVHFILYTTYLCACVCLCVCSVHSLYMTNQYSMSVALKFSTIQRNIENEFVFSLSLRLWLDMNKTWNHLFSHSLPLSFVVFWIWGIVYKTKQYNTIQCNTHTAHLDIYTRIHGMWDLVFMLMVEKRIYRKITSKWTSITTSKIVMYFWLLGNPLITAMIAIDTKCHTRCAICMVHNLIDN